jgi:predicted RNase H-like HicB family nuclease
MERVLNLHIKKLPEGIYLATSDDMPGLVAQGRTVSETLEIARDVAKKLIESQNEKQKPLALSQVGKQFDYPLIIGA